MEKAISVKIDKQTYDKVSKICKSQGYKIKSYIEIAIEQRIEKEKKGE